MAKHAFGIMQKAPEPGEWYVDYEPRKYRCICVHDDHVEWNGLKALLDKALAEDKWIIHFGI